SEEPRDDDEPRHDEPWRRRRPRYDDERDDDWDETRSGTGRMPPTVLTPVIVLSILLTLELILGALALATSVFRPEQLGRVFGQLIAVIVIGGLILWGLIAGHRLAWQWGRLVGMLAAVLYLLVGIMVLSAGIEGAPPAARFLIGALALIVSAGMFTIGF